MVDRAAAAVDPHSMQCVLWCTEEEAAQAASCCCWVTCGYAAVTQLMLALGHHPADMCCRLCVPTFTPPPTLLRPPPPTSPQEDSSEYETDSEEEEAGGGRRLVKPVFVPKSQREVRLHGGSWPEGGGGGGCVSPGCFPVLGYENNAGLVADGCVVL